MDGTDQTKIDEDYAKPALGLIRKVLKGNGVRTSDVTIKHFDGAVLNFTAATHITLSHKITEKDTPGKVAGGSISETRQAARQEAENHASTALQKSEIVEQIKNIIDQKPHHGFGLDNEAIKLPFLDRDFVSHNPCNPCHGKGRSQCTKCKGKGYQPCMHCNAEGFERCHECNGNRQIRGPQGQMQTCNLCQGLGKTSCSFCRENRQVQCNICQTKGETQCRSCGGHGAQSNIISTEITAQCIYDFDLNSLHDKAATLAKKLGTGLAEQAQITPVAKESEDNDALHLFYDVHVSQGNIEFSIKDKTVQAYLFGADGTIKEIPDFLDGIIAPGVKRLEKAASGQGRVGENIRTAVRYKTIRQAMTFAARYKSKKAIKALLHYTPLGLSARMAQKLITNADTALDNATKQQRIIAAISGAGSGIVLAAIYFLSPLRSALLAQINDASFHTAACVALAKQA